MQKSPPKPSYRDLERRILELERLKATQKVSEQALRENEEKYRLMIDTTAQMIALCDMNWTVLFINTGGLDLIGYDETDILGNSIFDFFEPESYENIRERLNEITHNSFRVDELCEAAFLHRNGDAVPVEVNAAPTLKEGVPIGFLFTAKDISKRRRIEEELLRAKKLESIGILAGGIAHDYNNLLTAIVGYITLAESTMKPGDEALTHLGQARYAANMAKTLSRKLITFSRGGKPAKKPAPVSPLLEDSLPFALAGSNIECELLIPKHLWPVEHDASQMSQAIHNIVTNSREAMPKGGTLRVKAENMRIRRRNGNLVEPGDWVRITIEDEGFGIPQQHMDKVFDPYFTTKEMGAQKGLGLGLAISHSIIRNHQGYLLVESEPDRGTTVHIYLPASNPARGREGSSHGSTRNRGAIRILVMDDEEIVLEITGKMLKRAGYEIGLAKNGAEAIRLFTQSIEEDNPFHLALLDLTVRGGIGGKEVVRKLLEIEPGLKAVVSSGFSDDPVMRDFPIYGFSAAVTKPYDIGDLREIIEKVFESGATPENEHVEPRAPKAAEKAGA